MQLKTNMQDYDKTEYNNSLDFGSLSLDLRYTLVHFDDVITKITYYVQFGRK